MVKLKFKKWSNVGDVLTCEELKHVCGGMSSGGSTGEDCEPGVGNTLKPINGQGGACINKHSGDYCSFQGYLNGNPHLFTGICKPFCIDKKITLACSF